MSGMIPRHKGRLFASTAAFALLIQTGTIGSASAQDTAVDADAEFEEVVVTGSRIKRQGFDTLQPAIVMDRDAIESRGLSNVGDALTELPAFGSPSSSTAGTQAGVGAGQTFVNFLGLGSQRSLTLVNGKRFVPANTPSIDGAGSPGLQVDMNTIPTALIERVETIAVGGAPIYGTDAIAGTINIIMKRDFEGFAGMAKVDATEHGGASQYQVQATYGINFHEDRGNLVVSVDHNQRGGLSTSDREVSSQYLSFEAPADPDSPYSQILLRDSRVGLTNFNGVILGVPFDGAGRGFPGPVSINGKPAVPFGFNLLGGGLRDGDGNLTQFDSNGNVVTFNPGTPTGSLVFKGGGDGFSIGDTADLLTDNKRQLINVMVNYELTDSIDLRMEGWYSYTSDTSLVSQPYFNGVAFASADETLTNIQQGPAPIRLSNPFVNDQARAIIGAGLDFDGDGVPDLNADFDGDGVPDDTIFWLDKGHQDIMRGSPTHSEQHLYRGLVGLEGDIELGDKTFDWDVTYTYGQTVGKSTATVIHSQRYSKALYATLDAGGNIVCEDPDPACVPINILGNGAPSDAAIDYVSGPASATTTIDQHYVSANFSGELFEMPAGPVGFAIGADYRRESSTFEPDEVLKSGEVQSFAIQSGTPIYGTFNTKEIYGEVYVPLVSPDMDIPLVNAFEFEGAARYVDNSVAGGDVTWTAGVHYSPIPGLKLRGNYTQSIRAPGITELFLPPSDTLARATDPCDQRFVDKGEQPTTRTANCNAAGITQPFNSLIVNASQPQTVSGNVNLESEKAKSWSVGAVIRPEFLPNLTLAVDWINIKLENAIENLDGTAILAGCYDSADYPNVGACDLITRDGLGQVTHISAGYVNAGLRDFAGLTADVSYFHDLGDLGTLGLTANYFYLDKLVTSVTGSDLNFDAGEVGQSKHRFTVNLRHNIDRLTTTLQMRHIGSAVFNNADAPNAKDVMGIGSWQLFNMSARYEITDNVSLQANINNVFDTKPPQYALAARQFGIPTYFDSVIGRTFGFTLRTQF